MKFLVPGFVFVIGVLVTVQAQSDFNCPPNPSMGLCEHIPNPCFTDHDCYNGEICCPHSCKRVCKPKMDPAQAAVAAADVPDLLNDPRVYVGKCPESSCFNLFGGEPNQCDTKNLCREEQYCCNDGCKNICKWKPEYEAVIAQYEARVRYQQHLVHQRQQAEMRKKEHEMRVQRQRQQAAAEQAKKAAQARMAAEAELKAQKAQAEYKAKLDAATALQAQAVSKMQQQMAQKEAAALLQLQQQQQATAIAAAKAAQQAPQQQPQQQPVASGQQQSPQAPASAAGSFLDNFKNTPPSNPAQQTAIAPPNSVSPLLPNLNTPSQPSQAMSGFFNSAKKNVLAGALINQVNSPANANPYNSANQNSYNKQLSLAGGNSAIPLNIMSSNTLHSMISNKSQFPPQSISPSNPYASTGRLAPPTIYNATPSVRNQPPRTYPYNIYPVQAQPQPQQQQQQQQQQQRMPSRRRNSGSNPFLMYHYMSTTA